MSTSVGSIVLVAVRVAVLSFWATTDPATVDKLRVYIVGRTKCRSCELLVSFSRRQRTSMTCMCACSMLRMYTGSTVNLANDFLTRNRTSQELAATCKYAFRKFLLFE